MSKTITPVQQIRNSLEKMAPEFQKALPSHVPVKKFIRVAQTAITTNKNIMKCDRTSLFASLTKAAEVGLMPDGKEAAIVPFEGKAKFVSMVAGKMKLARNSGEIKTLDSQVVYSNDDFKYWIDEDGPHLRHIPQIMGARGYVVCAYAIGKTKDGGVYIEVMTSEQLGAIESASRSKSGPWSGPFKSEMQRKSVMNRLLKRMPTSTDINLDMENDYSFSDVETEPEPMPVETVEEKPIEKDVTQPSRLAELVNEAPQGNTEVPI